MQLIDVLQERGLFKDATIKDPAALRARLASPLTLYCGFDPTADSLHIGSLVPIMGLYWAQQCGHRPLALVGGGTGLVGDPSGKTAARKMLTRDEVAANARAIAQQIGRVVRFDASATGAKLVNNADWLCGLSWIDLLREAGPHFSVNHMLSMDSVKGRMEAGGITFLEFNYMVMQAWDFLHLHRAEGCALQLGGQDQWGNIVMGIELARRKEGAELVGVTFPLVTKADGSKFGKSEGGNIWLSAERTPVHDFYQFWRNVADADVARFLGYFTTLPMDQVRALTSAGGAELNAAKEVLAFEVTRLIHGEAAAGQARDSARRAFGAGDVGGEAIPHAPLAAAELAAGIAVVDLLVRAGLCPSKSDARRQIEGKAVKLGEQAVSDPAARATAADAADGRLVLRLGKKRVFRFDVG
jgi:tyrosyl-tRNA synthetase